MGVRNNRHFVSLVPPQFKLVVGKGLKDRRIGIIVSIVVTVIMARIIHLIYRQYSDGQLLSENEFFEHLVTRMQSPVVHETFCDDIDKLGEKDCYKVTDMLMQTRSGKPVITRLIVYDAQYPVYMSGVILKAPQTYTEANLNTSTWRIDFDTFLDYSYTKEFFELPFHTKTLPLSTEAEFSVLSIGLGGGSINGAITKNFPNANVTVVELSSLIYQVASKWFDLEETKRQRVVIQNGIEFVEQAANKNESYDAVFLDACRDTQYGVSQCPTFEFYDLEVIKKMRDIIKPNGGLFINLVPQYHNYQADPQQAVPSPGNFDQVFPYCKNFTINGSMTVWNMVLSCRKTPFVDATEEEVRFVKSLVTSTFEQ